MREKRVVVPEGLLGAIAVVLQNNCLLAPSMGLEENLRQSRIVAESALRWLSENPIVPTDEQICEFYAGASEAGVSFEFLKQFSQSMQRRMFLAPDPEVPEAIEDLLLKNDLRHYAFSADRAKQIILEAYRRGQKSK